jgi:8-oxo-dGTP diphosphatase
MSASTRNTEVDWVRVSVGVLRDTQGRILITRRHEDTHQGGKWEFPGGKLMPGESAYAALVRELEEELGIEVTAAHPLIQVRHAYLDRKVMLEVFEVTSFRGTPHGRENQPLAWVAPSELDRYELPAADRPIVSAVGLPAFYPVLEHGGQEGVYRQRFQRLLERGYRMLYWRARDLPDSVYRRLAREFGRAMAAADGCLMVRAAGEPGEAPVGLHVSSHQLHTLSSRPAGWRRVGAACHCLADLQRVSNLGLDFAVLSPVLATPTHPDARPLGWQTARDWIASVNLPVYLMGGLGHQHLAQARDCGAQGIAGIRLFLE